MDRLPLVALLALACDGPAQPVTPAPSRVNAVKAEAQGPDLAALCDEVLATPAQAVPFRLPVLDGAVEPAAAGSWTWVNVWATWCAPCLEEMPRMHEWQAKLAEQGAAVDLRFISADARAEDVAGFRARGGQVPDGPRLADPAAMDAWLASLGLGAGGVLPVHLFVDPEGRLRCARMGAIGAGEFASVSVLVRGG